jgi:exodeoxyribonuclease V alpha subunit
VNAGEMPVLRNAKDGDFFFIEEEDPERIVETIRELCVSRLPNFYGVDPVDDIQILSPMLRGETGTINLNTVIRDALNPIGPSIRQSGTEFRMRDKVMQIRNNYDKNVFNGDIGRIVGIDTEARSAAIDFGGSVVQYESAELDEVVLAYAATVHKSQGSEYGIVILPFSTQHYMMLQRNLLYTAITRAKRAFLLVGTKKAVAMAVANDKIQKRNTKLAERLRK